MSLAIFVTGATGPDHDPVIHKLLTSGHHLWVSFSPGEQQWRDSWIDKAASLSGQLTALTLDMTAPDRVARELANLGQALDRLDVIVNLADHQGTLAPLEYTDDKLMQTLMMSNVISPMRVINGLLPVLRRQRKGMIVHCSTMAATCHHPLSTVYGCSKLAAERLVEGYRQELAPLGIECLILQAPDKRPRGGNSALSQDYRHLETAGSLWQAPTDNIADRGGLAEALMGLLEQRRTACGFRTVLDDPLAPLAESANQGNDDHHARLLHRLDLLQSLELADISA